MAERGSLQATLNAGIEAARAGDRATARRLLQQVIAADPDNEVAWMWMASAVETLAERRASLEQALKINPNNTRAQEALRRLVAQEAGASRGTVNLEEMERRRARRLAEQGRRRGLNIYLIAAAFVLIMVIVLISVALSTPAPTATQPPATAVALAEETDEPAAATETPFPGVVVTLDGVVATLPPTFTPTFTPTASATATATETPLPRSNYLLVYSAAASDGGESWLYRIRGDGSQDVALAERGGDFRDVVIDPTGERIAFVRDVRGPAGEDDTPGDVLPQLFVAPLSDPSAAVQITRLSGSELSHPTWSPDGARLAFASNHDGDLDIYIVAQNGGEPTLLTPNPGVDRDPAWSPDGATILYASDQDSPPYQDIPGSPEIYAISASGGTPTALTNANGDSYAPAWSPDGQWITFISTRGGDPDVYIMDANGHGETLVTLDDGGANDSDPGFSPDARSIVFISDREGIPQLYIVDRNGDNLMRVTAHNRTVQSTGAMAS